ncbi:hypothetical protein SAMN05192539_10559 [Paraburkholderia diazotrophica]|uniref:Uncharacterized protein n=1 Tax=Paraburkholderia diazotrophica TaxID=667676 RepID=A0A1H7EMR1_9BURK|nr:hypothetical protein SAMN05192539_10559 [Paraburkholderia diazotrophica]
MAASQHSGRSAQPWLIPRLFFSGFLLTLKNPGSGLQD